MEEECISPVPEVGVSPANVHGVSGGWPGRRVLGYCLYVALLSLAGCGLLMELGRYALKEELHSHILLIPFVSVYLAALKREALAGEGRGSVAGAVVGTLFFAVAAVAVFFGPAMAGAQSLGHHDMMVRTGACYALLLVAGGFLFLGTSWMRRLAFPFGLLVFMVPLPEVAAAGVEGFLMRASAVVADWFFQWTGTPVFRHGQVIELPGTTLEVARNCSGIRSTLVLFITSLVASYLFLSSSWHRGLLVAMVIPLGILRNALRVLVIGLLCVHVGPEMIESWVHRHGGPLFFVASLVPLFAMAAWFRHRERKGGRGSKIEDRGSGRSQRRVEFLGCPVDCLPSGELLAELKEGILAKAPPRVIQFVNANKVAMVRNDPWMGEVLERADYVLADGQPMLPMAAMLGLRIPERIDGIGLMHKLLGLADREGFSVYLLGAKQEIVEECVRRIGIDFPGVRIAGYRNGYFEESEIPEIAAAIRAVGPDFLFLGMGSPMKEQLADIWKEELGARVIQGVGGSFDVMAGMVKRAPRWMQRCGIEWLYRVLQEPRRMFWRYAKTNGSCLWVFANAFISRWFVRGGQIRTGRLQLEPRMDANGRELNVEGK